jgi:hypothetical protein
MFEWCKHLLTRCILLLTVEAPAQCQTKQGLFLSLFLRSLYMCQGILKLRLLNASWNAKQENKAYSHSTLLGR